jgi:hypothetical protein
MRLPEPAQSLDDPAPLVVESGNASRLNLHDRRLCRCRGSPRVRRPQLRARTAFPSGDVLFMFSTISAQSHICAIREDGQR